MLRLTPDLARRGERAGAEVRSGGSARGAEAPRPAASEAPVPAPARKATVTLTSASRPRAPPTSSVAVSVFSVSDTEDTCRTSPVAERLG